VDVTLHHRPGIAEWAGMLLSVAAAGVLLLAALARPAPRLDHIAAPE
jgi:hypothetical protein